MVNWTAIHAEYSVDSVHNMLQQNFYIEHCASGQEYTNPTCGLIVDSVLITRMIVWLMTSAVFGTRVFFINCGMGDAYIRMSRYSVCRYLVVYSNAHRN